MKNILILFIIALFSVTGLKARTFALITGVSNYESEENNLSQSTKDAKRFRELMETQTKDITLLTSSYVTKANVLEKLRAICNRAQKGDRIVFYYSGHGLPGGIRVFDQMLPYDELISVLSESEAGEKICFIDACFSGSVQGDADTGWISNAQDDNTLVLFVSSKPEEISRESSLIGAGIFTQALLQGMQGRADKDDNKEVTVMELFRYVYGDVLRRSNDKQHPQLIAPKDKFDMVVTRW